MAQATPSHPSAEQLSHFGLGRLSDAEAEAVARHLDQCPVCSAAAQHIAPDSFVGRVRKAGPVTSGTPVPPGTLSQSAVGRAGKIAAPPKDVPAELANHPKYQVLRELGRGGMGVVYQARQTIMNRQVVIKVISRAVLDRPDSLERFRREVQAAAQLSHPNIVTAYDAEQAGELHLLVMEFVPGQSLAEVLEKKGPLPVAHACHYMRQVALGLQHAHERGMVHRDIKPGNIMLMPKSQVKILDFGLAKMVSERRVGKGLTASDSYMGTPDYSAPEQATDARTADIRADVYSLGCTLYCLLAGRPPFEEDTPVKTILAHLEKPPRPLPELRPDVPAELWQVVSRLLAKDPAKRYQKPTELAQALLPFIKPGAQAEASGKVASVPARGSPSKATALAANTGEIKAILGAIPVKTPARKMSGDDEPGRPFAGLTDAAVRRRKGKVSLNTAKPTAKAWYRRWSVLAGAGGVLLLFAVAGLWVAGAFSIKVKTPEGTIVLDRLPDGSEVTLDGKTVFVKQAGDDRLVEIRAIPGRRVLEIKKKGISLETREVTLTDGERKPLHVRLEGVPGAVGKPNETPLPDNKRGLVVSRLQDGLALLALVRADGTEVRQLSQGTANDTYPAWSPDGKRIAFASDRAGKQGIYVMDADGENVRQLSRDYVRDRAPLYSPDGKKIAFTHDMENGNSHVFVMNSDGSNPTDVTESSTYAADPCWSPDGKKITFTSWTNDSGFRLQVIDDDGRNLHQLTGALSPVGWVYPAWSPDGKWIAYAANAASELEVFLASTDGQQRRQLTRLGGMNCQPVWSPDGKELAFVHLAPGASQARVYVVDAEGSYVRKVPGVRSPMDGGRPAWEPLGSSAVRNGPGAGEPKPGRMGGLLERMTKMAEAERGQRGPVPAREQTRAYWVHSRGYFKKLNRTDWIEVIDQGSNYFEEAERTTDYVQLKHKQGDVRVRLYRDSCQVQFGDSPYQEYYRGSWDSPKPKRDQDKPEGNQRPAIEPKSAGAQAARPNPSFVPLFNGRNLTGWRTEGGGKWHVDNNHLLVGTGPNAALATRLDDYKECTVRVRLSASADADAYLLLRMARDGNHNWSGMSTRVFGEDGMVQAGMAQAAFIGYENGMKRLHFKPGEEFTLEARTDGDVIWVTTNGELTAGVGLQPGRFPAGALGLIVVHGTVKIREFCVKEVGRTRRVGAKTISREDSSSPRAPNGATRPQLPQTHGATKNAPSTNAGFESLFKGKGLPGWRKVGSETTIWAVRGGEVVATNRGRSGQAAFLVTQRSNYTDFHLRADIQVRVGASNTLLAFRVDTSNDQPGGLPGYAVFIPGRTQTQDAAAHAVGTLGVGKRLKPFEPLREAEHVDFRRGHLLHLEVIARGPHLQVLVDGKSAVNYVDPENRFNRGGFWLLCRPGNMITFRRLEIKEL